MSEMDLGKTHIDALMTAALAWSETFVGDEDHRRFRYVDPFPESPTYGRTRTLSEDTADQVGRALRTWNFEHFWWDVSDEEIEEDTGGDSSRETVRNYVFEPLPGRPDPVAVLTAIDCYDYNTPSPADGEGGADDEAIGETARGFITWLRGAALHNLPSPDHPAALWPILDRDVFLPTDGVEPRTPVGDHQEAFRNEYPAPVEFGGVGYPSVIHAYWALAVEDDDLRAAIRSAPGPRDCKALASGHARPWWRRETPGVLAALMRAKYDQHPHLAQALLATGESSFFPGERHADGWLDTGTPGLTSTLLQIIRGELAARRSNLLP